MSGPRNLLFNVARYESILENPVETESVPLCCCSQEASSKFHSDVFIPDIISFFQRCIIIEPVRPDKDYWNE